MTNHCAYEQSQALREIGFDLPVRDYYDDKPILRKTSYEYNYSGIGNVFTSAPTHAEALEWFREKKGLDGWVEPCYEINGDKYYQYNILQSHDLGNYPTHHEATSALVDKCIEITKQQKVK